MHAIIIQRTEKDCFKKIRLAHLDFFFPFRPQVSQSNFKLIDINVHPKVDKLLPKFKEIS